jgi:hypothetical protein
MLSGVKHLVRFLSSLRSDQNDIPDFLTFVRGLLTAEVQVFICHCTNVSNEKAMPAYFASAGIAFIYPIN